MSHINTMNRCIIKKTNSSDFKLMNISYNKVKHPYYRKYGNSYKHDDDIRDDEILSKDNDICCYCENDPSILKINARKKFISIINTIIFLNKLSNYKLDINNIMRNPVEQSNFTKTQLLMN